MLSFISYFILLQNATILYIIPVEGVEQILGEI